MTLLSHLKLFFIVSTAWFLFWIAGLPDYYQQYSTKVMIIFDLAILPPIWLVIYYSAKNARPDRGLTVSLWWSFYISFPLLIFDLLYAGLYLGRGFGFLWRYWYLTVYYILPWLLFPLTGWFVDRRKRNLIQGEGQPQGVAPNQSSKNL
jgi:hypothetical protein